MLQFKTIASQYGEAERMKKIETSYEPGRPAPGDEIYDDFFQENKDKEFV
jgi:hypothetical protein